MPDKSEIKALLKEFQRGQKALTAIGDEVRQHIIIKMLDNEEECNCKGMRVGQITALTNLSRPAVSQIGRAHV